MVVVLTGYNRNSKFDLVANASTGKNLAPVLRLAARRYFDGQTGREKDNYTFCCGSGRRRYQG
jgi:hypothetical protein